MVWLNLSFDNDKISLDLTFIFKCDKQIDLLRAIKMKQYKTTHLNRVKWENQEKVLFKINFRL